MRSYEIAITKGSESAEKMTETHINRRESVARSLRS